MQLIGYQKVVYKDKDSGENVNAYALYFVQPILDQKGSGYSFDIAKGSTSSIFIREDILKKKGISLKCGAEYNYSFNRNGFLNYDSFVKVS